MEANRRSDLVRARRVQRSNTVSSKPRKDHKAKASNTRSMPPVYSRAGLVYPTTTSVSKKVRARERRKYNVLLESAGAEVKLPAIPVVSVGWRVLSGVMTIGLLFALYWLWTAPMFSVEAVTLNGFSRVDQGDLLARANIIGKPVFAIDPQELETNLSDSINALQEISVTVSFPAEVIFDAVECRPVIIWEQAGVTSWWVDNNGVRFAPLGSSEGLIYIEAKAPPPQLYTIQANAVEDGPQDSDQLLSAQMVSGIMYLSDYLPEGSTFMFDEEHGIGWEDPETGALVYFGKELDQMPIRIALYQAITADLTARNRVPVLISIEQVKAPYYRMRN